VGLTSLAASVGDLGKALGSAQRMTEVVSQQQLAEGQAATAAATAAARAAAHASASSSGGGGGEGVGAASLWSKLQQVVKHEAMRVKVRRAVALGCIDCIGLGLACCSCACTPALGGAAMGLPQPRARVATAGAASATCVRGDDRSRGAVRNTVCVARRLGRSCWQLTRSSLLGWLSRVSDAEG
jgi:hypothetical protein